MLRLLKMAAASTAVLAIAACGKAGDQTAQAKGPTKFDVQYCASETVDAPIHISPLGCILSPNKAFALTMQPSGALELFQVTETGQPGKVLWSSGATGASKDKAAADFQGDGNLVIYDGSKPIWNSHSVGKGGAFALFVTDQGNAVIKTPDGQTIWSAQFDSKLCPAGLDAPAQLTPGGCIVSPGKTFAMMMLKSGSMAVAPLAADGTTGTAVWTSGNHMIGPGETFAALQTDGNLVVYVNNKPVWNSTTGGSAGAFHLDLSDDGELKLHRADGAVIWSSKAGKTKTKAG